IPATNAKAVYNMAAFDIDGDGWRDVVLGRGNPAGGHMLGSTEVWMNNGKPALAFSYPAGQPGNIAPNTSASFQVQLTGLTGGTPLANGAVMHISVNGAAFAPVNLALIGDNLYQATISPQACASSIRYYIAGKTAAGGTCVDPHDAPESFYSIAVAASTTMLLNENFEGAT